jgi:hypothetical protein
MQIELENPLIFICNRGFSFNKWIKRYSQVKLEDESYVTVDDFGIIMSLTSEDTILLNAPPIITPMAKSTIFPRIANALNSFAYTITTFPN